ncbi:MAG: ATP-binding protein [Rhodocyclaceae bacterium]|nr:ATP-binding protein [Rhodocyclaceae bacterium]
MDYRGAVGRGRGPSARRPLHPAPHRNGPLSGPKPSISSTGAKEHQPTPNPEPLSPALYRGQINVIFIGNVGPRPTSASPGHAACLAGYPVLFTTAVELINSLSAAQAHGNLKRELRKYLQPRLLLVDELGYLPIDKARRRLVIPGDQRPPERGALVLTSPTAPQALAGNLPQRRHPHLRSPRPRVLHHAENRPHRGQKLPA